MEALHQSDVVFDREVMEQIGDEDRVVAFSQVGGKGTAGKERECDAGGLSVFVGDFENRWEVEGDDFARRSATGDCDAEHANGWRPRRGPWRECCFS